MKTKNEYEDWIKAVMEMEKGSSYEDATATHAPVVQGRAIRQTSPRTKFVSKGQLNAVRREFNG